jgi:predicted component of type VI protein secretion system
MDEGRKKLLEKVPTRKLLASIKRDMRKMLRTTATAAKPKKK